MRNALLGLLGSYLASVCAPIGNCWNTPSAQVSGNIISAGVTVSHVQGCPLTVYSYFTKGTFDLNPEALRSLVRWSITFALTGRAEVITWCWFHMDHTPYPAPPMPITMVRRPKTMTQRD